MIVYGSQFLFYFVNFDKLRSLYDQINSLIHFEVYNKLFIGMPHTQITYHLHPLQNETKLLHSMIIIITKYQTRLKIDLVPLTSNI